MTGLEPATSGVTGRCSNQLSYIPIADARDAGGENPSGGGGVRQAVGPATCQNPRGAARLWAVKDGRRSRAGGPRVQVSKAIITAAGRGAKQYPAADTVQKTMLPLVDRDGLTKPVLQIIAEEAVDSGIEQICLVVAPGDEPIYRRQLRAYGATLRESYRGVSWAEEQARRLEDLEARLVFAVQHEPIGYGHAVWSAREFAADGPVLLLLGDHVYHSRDERRCARQLLDLAEAKECAVSAVQATREHLIHQYGTVAGRKVGHDPNVYEIEKVLEKPSPTVAEVQLQVPGLRAAHYLCFFGMHVLTPRVFALLDRAVAAWHETDPDDRLPIGLTPALDELARIEAYLALETLGDRHNLGVKFGTVEAQIALAMAGADRDRMLALLLESALQVQGPGARPVGAVEP